MSDVTLLLIGWMIGICVGPLLLLGWLLWKEQRKK